MIALSSKENNGHKTIVFCTCLAAALCLVGVVGAVIPRSIALLPPLLGLVAYMVQWGLTGQRAPICRPFLYIAVGVFALSGLSAFWAVDAGEAWSRSYKTALIMFPSVLLISVIVASPPILKDRFVRFAPYMLLFAFGLNVIELLSGGYIHAFLRGGSVDANFNFSNLNRGIAFATFLIFPVWGAYCLVKTTTHEAVESNDGQKSIDCRCYKKWAMPAASMALIVAVFSMTESQSTHLCFAIGLIFWCLARFMRPVLWWSLWAGLTLVVLISPWIAIYMFNILPDMLRGVGWFENAYAMHRMEIWDFVSRYALQNPLYGYGMEATQVIKDFDSQLLYFETRTVLHPHNFGLQIWIEFGLLGVTALALFFAYAFSYLRRFSPLMLRVSLTTFMAVLAVASTGYGLWQGWFIGTMMLLSGYCAILNISQGADS